MELGERAARHVASCVDIPEENMRAFAEATVRAVLAAGDETEDAAATGLGSAEAEAGIALLTVEAAKGDISGEDLETLINDEFGIGGGRAKTLAEVYTRHKPRLVEALAAHAFASPVPRMTAVSWRADHVISSSEAGTPRGRHQFFVAFKTTAPAASGAEAGYDSTDALRGAGEEIRFACTLEQMQHLVGTLRDACRAAERFP